MLLQLCTSASTVIARLDRIFSVFGLPHVVRSENGPPFSSNEFKLFAEDLGCDTQMVKEERRSGKFCKTTTIQRLPKETSHFR